MAATSELFTKRASYRSHDSILAPLKCGTRVA
jgi:hypothetical protein